MTRLYVTQVLENIPHTFLQNKSFRSSDTSLLLSKRWLYYAAVHIKLASSSYFTQLVEIFAYENPKSRSNDSILVYQFHGLLSQERIFFFVVSPVSSLTPSVKSIVELFTCAWWLEREAGEMHGVCFAGKKDLRNLMLQYGDASSPFRKSFPSIGHKELIYDSVTDTLLQIPVTTQL